eukprot:6885092-Lingulodinium_polyedra.AAC.1
MQYEALRRWTFADKGVEHRVTISCARKQDTPPAVTERVSGVPAIWANGVVRQASVKQGVAPPVSAQ